MCEQVIVKLVSRQDKRLRERTCVTEIPSVATFTVTISISSVRDLATAVLAGQTPAGVEQLPLLVAQGAAVTFIALAAVRLRVKWDTFSVDAPVNTQVSCQIAGININYTHRGDVSKPHCEI